MAVQTHHQPYDPLLLKRRNEQEVNTTRDQLESPFFISDIAGYSNQKKRGREMVPANFSGQFLTQPVVARPQKMMRLDQLQKNTSHHPPPSALVSTGLQLAFADQNQNLNNIRIPVLYSPTATATPSSSSFCCQDLAGRINGFDAELDQLLHAQGEQLRQAMAQKLQAHYKQLLLAAEKSTSKVLEKKQAELDSLARRSAELEAQLSRWQTESFAWQAKAVAQQANATAIHAQIQQAMAEANECQEPVDDAGSACIDQNGPGEAIRLTCKVCREKEVSAVVLPCGHLCLCEDCDTAGAAETCPVCRQAGSGSVRVLMC